MCELCIIAAGKGERLKNEGLTVSKPLTEINGVPLIKRITDIAVKNGFTTVNCIINEEADDLKRFLTDGKNISASVNLIVKSTESSLHSLYELSKFASFPFLLTTADSVFTEKDFANYIDYAKSKKDADGVFAVTDFVDDEKPLYVATDDDLRITNFYDTKHDAPFVSGGLYFFKKDVKKELEEAVKSGMSRLRNFQRFLIEKAYKIYAYPFGKIIDVDHLSDIAEANEFLKNNLE